ncbi:6160_t:CDS:2, partial [Ambispora gerdemannii]
QSNVSKSFNNCGAYWPAPFLTFHTNKLASLYIRLVLDDRFDKKSIGFSDNNSRGDYQFGWHIVRLVNQKRLSQLVKEHYIRASGKSEPARPQLYNYVYVLRASHSPTDKETWLKYTFWVEIYLISRAGILMLICGRNLSHIFMAKEES